MNNLCAEKYLQNFELQELFDLDFFRENESFLKLVRKLQHHPYEFGRNRVCFFLKNNVIKIPRNGGGIGDNDWEGSVSTCPEFIGSPDHIQYAKTRLLYVEGIEVVVMEKVCYANESQIERVLGPGPNWTWSVDCGQVGFNRHGRLVAYDYGYN